MMGLKNKYIRAGIVALCGSDAALEVVSIIAMTSYF